MRRSSRRALLSATVLLTSCTLAALALPGDPAGHDPILATEVETAQRAITVPAGFVLTNTWNGKNDAGVLGTAVRTYRKDYAGGQPDYVTVVDLRYGSIRNFTGAISGNSPCRVSSTKYLCSSSSTANTCANGTFWTDAGSVGTADRVLRVLVNGTFFATGNNPTGLAFGLKTNGSTISLGYGVNWDTTDCSAASEFPGNTFTFRFNNATNSALATNYDRAHFDTATFPDVVGGLNPTCCKSPTSNVQRTLVGTRDDVGGDGVHETVFFFSSALASLTHADSVLRAFGATNTAQLDGGGSTGLVISGTNLIRTTRLLPHAIAIYSGQ